MVIEHVNRCVCQVSVMESVMRKTQKKKVANDHGQEINAFVLRYKICPLEHMLKILNNDRLPMKLRCAMAAAAAPYCHSKLQSIAIDDVGGLEEESVDLSKLTDAERERFEQLLAKAK